MRCNPLLSQWTVSGFGKESISGEKKTCTQFFLKIQMFPFFLFLPTSSFFNLNIPLFLYNLRNLFESEARGKIAIVGKYMGTPDAYVSLERALEFAMLAWGQRMEIEWWDVEEKSPEDLVTEGICGLIIPGGFGSRGTEQMIEFLSFAKTYQIPTLGICLGFQLMVIEEARAHGILESLLMMKGQANQMNFS